MSDLPLFYIQPIFHLRSVIFIFRNVITLFKIVLLLFKYSCLHLLPSTPPNPSHPHFPSLILPPSSFCVHVSFIVVPENPSLFPPHYPHPPPLWLLSVCSLFKCLWLYFTCLLVLLIRFH